MSNEQFEYKTQHGDAEQVQITLDFYQYNNNLYLGMDYYDTELGGWDSYGDITINTESKMPYLYSTIDTNTFGEEIVTFLEENGFGQDTGKVVSSGWCIYPIFQFNEDALQRVCPNEFQEYQKVHGIEPKELQVPLRSPSKETFYFSFGTSESFPHRLGWVEVQAESKEMACDLFRSHYPDRTEGILNCAFVYSQNEWKQADMDQGNPGQVCHRVIDSLGPFKGSLLDDSLESVMVEAKERAAEKSAARPDAKKNRKPPEIGH